MPPDIERAHGSIDEGVYLWMKKAFALNKPFLLRSEILDLFAQVAQENQEKEIFRTGFAEQVRPVQEAAVREPWAYFAVRPQIAGWEYFRAHAENMIWEETDVEDYLAFKELIVSGDAPRDVLRIDFAPFEKAIPKMTETYSIGHGMTFLNRKLSSELFQELETPHTSLLDFLYRYRVNGQEVLLGRPFRSAQELRQALRQATRILERQPPDAPWGQVEEALGRLGFAQGWGAVASRILETMRLLMDILEAPSPAAMEEFLSRLPMITRLLVVSVHGFFAQGKVLGYPDTGGQVVYILDQVRALEQAMVSHLRDQGLAIDPQIVILTRLIPDARGTTCNERLEKVAGCNHTSILRVPFFDQAGQVVPHWISRFAIWPYLPRFADDAEREVLLELKGQPDLIIGNYSDGNLVATLLAQRLRVTQCNIAHALEKTKYLFSDLYWKDNDPQYHFSCQYTADLIAMESADFIITSTYQEIAGTSDTVGQYESYQSFTMPGLYRVRHGVDPFDPKFNIVSPGADEKIYFPHASENRLKGLVPQIEALIYGDPDDKSRGKFARRDLPLVFSMARLDHIKNLVGLVRWYGSCPSLREVANLLIVGGMIHAEESQDAEEREQIALMHQAMDEFGLDNEVRWVGARLDKAFAGELYRVIADKRGVFVQPAWFEAFGLTVIEAMATGLPIFATCYGGPLEIIEENRSGYHIDPNKGVEAAEKIAAFLLRAKANPHEWQRISEGAIARVESRYTWRLYAQRLLSLSRIYGFWKFVSDLEREELKRYLHMFYQLQYKPLAARIGE